MVKHNHEDAKLIFVVAMANNNNNNIRLINIIVIF